MAVRDSCGKSVARAPAAERLQRKSTVELYKNQLVSCFSTVMNRHLAVFLFDDRVMQNIQNDKKTEELHA
ncbi:hypothetical protein FOA20_01055 [Peribacillus simplex]